MFWATDVDPDEVLMVTKIISNDQKWTQIITDGQKH